jgi:hypothetical protein
MKKMNPNLKNVLAVILGFIVGFIVNGGIISVSGSIIPLPEGVDPNDIESIKAAMPNYEMKHFIMPFLAHALGVIIGAFVTAKMAVSHHFNLALIIGGLFLVGGIIMAVWLPAPIGFEIFDLVFAYIPMAWLGWKLAGGIKG